MIPEAKAPLDSDLPARKETLDVSRIFLAYLATFGDVVKTADVAGCRISDVLYLSQTECWDKKLAECQLSRGDSEKAKEQSREVNRMANYIQALRLRGVVDKTLQWIYENEENVEKFAREVNKQGKPVFSTKPILDLVKAAEAVHAMSYRALGDTIVKEEGGAGAFGSLKSLHLTIVEQMKSVGTLPEAAIKEAERMNQTDAAAQSVGYLDVEAAMSQ